MQNNNIFKRLSNTEWKSTEKSISNTASNFMEDLRTNIQNQEKIINKNNLLSIAWLSRGLEMAKSVARIHTINGKGTGFLIQPDLLITNHHVLPNAETAASSTAEFNYEKDWSGNEKPTRKFKIDSSVFRTNEKLDYTIVRVLENPGAEFGFIDLTKRANVKIGQNVVIIQHPGGRHKEICLTDNEVKAVDKTLIQYATDTEPGSSGSCVFDGEWNIVGLHHGGGPLINVNTGEPYFGNEAVSINAIVEDANELLALSNELWDLASTEMRNVLENILITVKDETEIKEAAKLLMESYPRFNKEINKLVNNSSINNEIDPFTAAAIGVGVGAAIRHWGHVNEQTLNNDESFNISNKLITALSPLVESEKLPSEVYSTVYNMVVEEPDLIKPLVHPITTEDFGISIAVMTAAAFLSGVAAGAKAYDGAK
ncbi:hypothetical protein COJ90_20860 [Priestia megaterium]|uniref:trypsin-like serine peptidase n=1 Tax=Priestia megaterium TaxID=1404 RepID=UPI000BF4EEF1|nr:serine protease [Priestia megaterium]PFP09362.1 hypothetical protein COJ90_20860 [Priestia megaterium]